MKYRLLHPTQPNSGMFAFIWQTLRGMYHFPDDYYYVLFGQESCYWDNEIKDKSNVWDYYFEQPHINTIPSIADISSEIGLLFDEFSEFRDLCLTPETYIERCKAYNAIILKHVRLLPHMKNKIDKFYNEKLLGYNILGVHCRGTDHPDKKDVSYTIDFIREFASDYDKIFITSDEQNRIDSVKQAFGDKVVEYPVIMRSNGNTPLHYGNKYSLSKYQIGEDVICEAYLLALTNRLLCGTGSNVNFFVRALNPNLKYNIQL